jgi:hypothetical protein
MTEALTKTDLQGALPLIARGKVRDLYEIDDKTLLFVATDRISAYDVIMENVRKIFSIMVRLTSSLTLCEISSGHSKQRETPHPLHKNVVQDPPRCHPISPHPLTHPRPSTSDSGIAPAGVAQSEHAGSQIQDLPRRGHRAGLHHRIRLEGVSEVRHRSRNHSRTRAEGERSVSRWADLHTEHEGGARRT